MREIKFRVWSPRYREFFYFCIGQEFSWKLEEHPDQFTGMKDKNGSEIYEGDILIREEQDPENGFMYLDSCLVAWDNIGGKWVGRFLDETLSLEDFCTTTGEVGGNIYENPELIGIA